MSSWIERLTGLEEKRDRSIRAIVDHADKCSQYAGPLGEQAFKYGIFTGISVRAWTSAPSDVLDLPSNALWSPTTVEVVVTRFVNPDNPGHRFDLVEVLRGADEALTPIRISFLGNVPQVSLARIVPENGELKVRRLPGGDLSKKQLDVYKNLLSGACEYLYAANVVRLNEAEARIAA